MRDAFGTPALAGQCFGDREGQSAVEAVWLGAGIRFTAGRPPRLRDVTSVASEAQSLPESRRADADGGGRPRGAAVPGDTALRRQTVALLCEGGLGPGT